MRAASYTSGKSVWLVVNLPEKLGRVGTVDDEMDSWQRVRDEEELHAAQAQIDEQTWHQGVQ